MGALGNTMPTLADAAKLMDPSGRIAKVVEILNQYNGILTDMPWFEGNLPTGHQATIRTGLPTVYWRLVNQGVQPSKGTTAQVTEGCGILEAYAEVDKKVADLNGNTAEFRLAQTRPFLEAFSQEMAQTLFYGNSGTAPEEFNGLSIRFNSSTAGNGRNVVKAGGSGSDNASVWLVGWGEGKVFGVFPKGSTAGLEHTDKGLVTIENAGGVSGARMEAYRDHFVWNAGVVVEDWRYVVRVCNIDVSDLVANSAPADLNFYLTKAYHRLQSKEGCKPVWYMNRTVFEFLDIQRQAAVKNGGGITYENVDGMVRPTFRGIPIVVNDQLLETEATVS